MLVTSPQPATEDLEKYYDSKAYISHSDADKGLMAFMYQRVKSITLSRKVKLVNKLAKKRGTLADIGAGTGDFLGVVKTDGWEVKGAEPNSAARKRASHKGIDLVESIDELSYKTYDVVTLWHVLEHLPELDTEVNRLKRMVKPGGYLIIAVPNYKSYDAAYYKEYWAAFDVPRHLWHFSRKSIITIFSDSMHLVKVKPMWFDAFYVSLLSEKYKSGNSFSIKALFIGLWSNIKALNSKEYSSLIYCFQKPA